MLHSGRLLPLSDVWTFSAFASVWTFSALATFLMFSHPCYIMDLDLFALAAVRTFSRACFSVWKLTCFCYCLMFFMLSTALKFSRACYISESFLALVAAWKFPHLLLLWSSRTPAAVLDVRICFAAVWKFWTLAAWMFGGVSYFSEVFVRLLHFSRFLALAVVLNVFPRKSCFCKILRYFPSPATSKVSNAYYF